MISIQPAQTTDGSAEYNPLLPLPYPYHVLPGGDIDRQDFWRGSPSRLIGFQFGRTQRITLTIEDFEADPEKAVGLCPVFVDAPRQSDREKFAEDHVERAPDIWADARPITRVVVS